MTSDVVLSAAMRTNLLSLQSTQNSIDLAQRNLGTGKKVNSALDGPQAFFASRALTNRAADLTKLLDSIGQSVQVIKAADTGVTALTSLVEQADSIANQAQEALASGTAEAKVTGNKDLRGINDLTSLSGVTANDTITLSLSKPDGSAQEIAAYGGAGAASVGVQITANMSTDQLLAAINDIRIDDDGAGGAAATGAQAFEASLNDKGQLVIKSLNGGSYRAVFAGGGGAGDTDAEDLALASDLGFGGIARSAGDQTDVGTGDTSIEFTAVADVALRSFNFVDTSTTNDDVATRSTLLTNLRKDTDPNAVAALFDADNAGDDFLIAVNGKTVQTVELNGSTVQDVIDGINSNTALNSQIKADFDEETGQITIRALSADVKDIQIGVRSDATAATANFGFGNTTLAGVASTDYLESIQLGSSAGQLAKLEQDFNKIRDQIDALVSNGDTGYRGTNLLNGDDLQTVFNEDRTSTITTKGVTFTSEGLGIKEANFSNATNVEGVIDAVRDALTSVREFGSTLANDLSVIQTRQTFTTSLINTLKEGSDKLVNADQNEEGAKLLALQTRQSLGVTALSLASQSQQSILRLF